MSSIITLTDAEALRFSRLAPQENVAFRFWKEVFKSRGLQLANTKTIAVEVRPIVGTNPPQFRVLHTDVKIKKPAKV